MRTLIATLFLLGGCGLDPGGNDYREEPAPAPSPTPNPDPDPWSAEIQGLVKEQCALAGCHAGATFVSSGTAFRASSSLRRIQSGNMPLRSSPNYGIYNDTKKRKLIDYLSNP